MATFTYLCLTQFWQMGIFVIIILVLIAVVVFYTALGIFVLIRLGYDITFNLDKAWERVTKKSKEYKDFEKQIDDLL